MKVNGKKYVVSRGRNLFDTNAETPPDNREVLTHDEIAQARHNKREAHKKVATFANAPMYHTLHTSMR